MMTSQPIQPEVTTPEAAEDVRGLREKAEQAIAEMKWLCPAIISFKQFDAMLAAVTAAARAEGREEGKQESEEKFDVLLRAVQRVRLAPNQEEYREAVYALDDVLAENWNAER